MNETLSTQEHTPTRKLWFDGVNHTADAVIVNTTDRTILLIQRGDTGEWALPGGFVNENEPTLLAAQREAKEETGIEITDEGSLIYQGVVDDPRNSDTAWIETSAYLFLHQNSPDVSGLDDAVSAEWIPLDTLPELYGSHSAIVTLALAHVDQECARTA